MQKGFTFIEFLLLLAIIALLVGLVISGTHKVHLRGKAPTIQSSYINEVGIVKEFSVDGCQYLKIGDTTTHKGNCTNHIDVGR